MPTPPWWHIFPSMSSNTLNLEHGGTLNPSWQPTCSIKHYFVTQNPIICSTFLLSAFSIFLHTPFFHGIAALTFSAMWTAEIEKFTFPIFGLVHFRTITSPSTCTFPHFPFRWGLRKSDFHSNLFFMLGFPHFKSSTPSILCGLTIDHRSIVHCEYWTHLWIRTFSLRKLITTVDILLPTEFHLLLSNF